jgi:hypothetical protein
VTVVLAIPMNSECLTEQVLSNDISAMMAVSRFPLSVLFPVILSPLAEVKPTNKTAVLPNIENHAFVLAHPYLVPS